MRAFITLCIIGIACAKHLGYTYEPSSYSNNRLSYGPITTSTTSYAQPSNSYISPVNTGASYSISPSSTLSYSTPYQTTSSLSGNSYSSPSYSPASYTSSSYSGPSYSAPGYSSSAYSAPAYNVPSYSAPTYSTPSYNSPSYSAPTQTASSYSTPGEVHKEFYTFSAPESEFEDTEATQRAINSVKQGLRVIFIKGPENKGYEDAALSLAKHAAEQQTTIFVLNKQHDIGDLANKLNAVNKKVNGKPDVHFVKYRTPEDAVNAQRAIQSQYDTLAGKSESINGGVAPVLNFASRGTIPSSIVQQPENTYLPSSIYRSRV